MLSDNLYALRKRGKLTQEQVAAQVGVSRQTLSKWETGESVPDIGNCMTLADFYDVSLDDLVRYCPGEENLPIPPKGKHFFGTVTIGPNGELTIPRKAMEVIALRPGEELMLLGEEGNGLALAKKESFLDRLQKSR